MNFNETTEFCNPFTEGFICRFDLHFPFENGTGEEENCTTQFGRNCPTTCPTYDSDCRPTDEELRTIVRCGRLFRRVCGQPNPPDFPYGPNSTVQCDKCNDSNLTIFLHYGEQDLCLPCCDKVWCEYNRCSRRERSSAPRTTPTTRCRSPSPRRQAPRRHTSTTSTTTRPPVPPRRRDSSPTRRDSSPRRNSSPRREEPTRRDPFAFPFPFPFPHERTTCTNDPFYEFLTRFM